MKKLISILILFLFATMSLFSATNAQQLEIQPLEYDDIEPYTGMIPPGHFLYGAKLIVEDIDEVFTFDRIKLMEKKMAHAELRIAEVKHEMIQNRSTEQIMNKYHSKMNEVDFHFGQMSGATVTKNNEELTKIQLQVERQHFVLGKIMVDDSDNTGFVNAVQNTNRILQNFNKKIIVQGD